MGQLIKNGTFAQPFAGDRDYYRINGDNVSLLGGWTLTTPGVGVDVYGTKVSRSQYQALDLNGDDRNGVSQDFYPTIGKQVTISWRAIQNPHPGYGCPEAAAQTYEAFVVNSDDEVVASRRYTPLEVWTRAEVLTFPAKDNVYTLTFASESKGWCGATITDVIVDETNEQ